MSLRCGYLAEPSALRRLHSEQQFVVITTAKHRAQRIASVLRVPPDDFLSDGERRRIDAHPDARGRRHLTQPVRQTIAEIHTARCCTVSPQQKARADARFGVQVSFC